MLECLADFRTVDDTVGTFQVVTPLVIVERPQASISPLVEYVFIESSCQDRSVLCNGFVGDGLTANITLNWAIRLPSDGKW